MTVSRRGRVGRGRSGARSNGTKPYLSACRVYGGAGGAPADFHLSFIGGCGDGGEGLSAAICHTR